MVPQAKILIHYEKGVPPTSEELAKKLESKKEKKTWERLIAIKYIAH